MNFRWLLSFGQNFKFKLLYLCSVGCIIFTVDHLFYPESFDRCCFYFLLISKFSHMFILI